MEVGEQPVDRAKAVAGINEQRSGPWSRGTDPIAACRRILQRARRRRANRDDASRIPLRSRDRSCGGFRFRSARGRPRGLRRVTRMGLNAAPDVQRSRALDAAPVHLGEELRCEMQSRRGGNRGRARGQTPSDIARDRRPYRRASRAAAARPSSSITGQRRLLTPPTAAPAAGQRSGGQSPRPECARPERVPRLRTACACLA